MVERAAYNILIHDAKETEFFLEIKQDEITIISDNGKIIPCLCCYGCWIETPGKCVLNDEYNNMGALMSKCDRMIIISQCFYGGYSPFVKNVLDRCVPYLLPYLETKNGETHHPKRYDNAIALTVYFYGDISDAEKETAKKLVKSHLSMVEKTEVYFYKSIEEIKEIL
jgi:multimeric flavodoxin WrbA